MGHEWGERDENLSGGDWECSWITEGMIEGGSKREERRALRTALQENRSDPRAPSVSLLRPHLLLQDE